jgi:hypothetical protein
LLTSVNTRQGIVESVGVYVKAIEALKTPQMKALLTSLPVFSIRVLDIVASGEAKLLYHSITNLIWNVIELLGQDETTLALAEVTALFVNALEREREWYGPWNRKRSRVRKNRVKVASMQRISTVAAINARKRFNRNRYISQTYTKRVVLKDKAGEDDSASGIDGDATVEDAILSSLGDGTRSDSAWLTALGRNDYVDDAASLPSRVILPKIDSNAELSVGSIHFDEFDVQSDHIKDNAADGEERQTIDISYLRDGIKLRREKAEQTNAVKMSRPYNNNNTHHLSTTSIAESSIESSENFDIQHSIEDLVLGEEIDSHLQNIPAKQNESKLTMSKGLDLEHEDDSIDSDEQKDDLDSKLKSNCRLNDGPARGVYSSAVQHFYRSVEDLQTKLRNEKIRKELQKPKMKGTEHISGVSVGQSGNKIWQSRAVAAAGAGNEAGQNIFCRGAAPSLPTRFRENIEHKEENEENMILTIITSIGQKLIRTMSRRQKLIIGSILSGLCIFVAVWFLLGCYGLYFLIQQVSSNGPHQMPIYAGGSQREIVLRIVQDSSVQKALNQHTIVAAAAEAIKGVGGGEL